MTDNVYAECGNALPYEPSTEQRTGTCNDFTQHVNGVCTSCFARNYAAAEDIRKELG